MTKISVEELAKYFVLKGKLLTTPGGLCIHLLGEELFTQYCYPDSVSSDFEFTLFTESENLHEFIEGYKIKSIGDIENLDHRNIWIRYLNSEATMEVIQTETEEAPVNFRLHRLKTMIFSLDMHYYDEVINHLTLPEDFIEYFYENERNLRVAFDNRYKF